jgi:hypothetical protein
MYVLQKLVCLLLIFSSGALCAHPQAVIGNVERVKAIPDELRGVTINDQRDIADFFDAKSAQHESAPDIRFSRHDGGNYVFQQWINGVSSDNEIHIYMREDLTIYRMDGFIDRRQYPPPVHKLNEAQAIEKVLLHIRNGGKRMFFENAPIVTQGYHHSMILYREAMPWRGVAIKVDHSRSRENGSVWDHEWYLVNPEGDVVPWLEGGDVHGAK